MSGDRSRMFALRSLQRFRDFLRLHRRLGDQRPATVHPWAQGSTGRHGRLPVQSGSGYAPLPPGTVPGPTMTPTRIERFQLPGAGKICRRRHLVKSRTRSLPTARPAAPSARPTGGPSDTRSVPPPPRDRPTSGTDSDRRTVATPGGRDPLPTPMTRPARRAGAGMAPRRFGVTIHEHTLPER